LQLSRARGIALICGIACSISVPLILVPSVIAERLPIKTYTTADGLARDTVNRIVQDSKGFLWFCTSEGLSRFDGYKFTNYGTDDGLAGGQVYDFLEARNGFYWVATNKGLCRFIPDAEPSRAAGATGRKFVVYDTGETREARFINSIYEDHAGTIWCCTWQGIYRGDQVSGNTVFSLVNISEPGAAVTGVPFRVDAAVEDRHGSLWVIAFSGVYRVLPGGAVERYPVDEGLADATLLEDREGLIWVSARYGLYQLVRDPKPQSSIVARHYTVKDGLPGSVSSVRQASDGTLWIGTSVGLSRFVRGQNEAGGRFQTYTEANGISQVTALCEDRDHNLWIGTLSKGAMRLAASGFVTYNEADGLGRIRPEAARVSSIFENQAHELCILTSDKDSISKFESGRFTAVPLTLPRGMSYWGWGWYQLMFQDHSGEWWMTTGQGLVRYPRLTNLRQITRAHPKAIYKMQDGLPTNDIFRLYQDTRGDIWIGTMGNANQVLARREQATGTFHRYSQADGIPDHAPTAFCDDGAGNVWIGFYHGGLVRYSGGRFTPFTVSDGVPPGFVQGFCLDHARRLWIATGEGGVARVDHPGDERPTFTIYSTADGLSSNQADSIIEDRWGMIYVGTGRGVDRIDPATGHIRHYTTADGLASNWIGVSFRDQHGALWFGTLLGVSRLDPQPEPPTSPPPILITALRVAGVPHPISELGAASIAGPELSASQNDVQIEFAGLSFAAGESLRYQYKLEGASLDWSAPTDQRVVTYPTLPPGSYRFLVRAVRSDGTASELPAAASFRILPPLWRRWWFLLAASALVVTVGYSLARSRIARMRAARESDRRFRTLAETASDAIITIDENGHIVLANHATAKTFGYRINEMLGKELTMLMPEYLRELHREGFARYKQTGVRHISWQSVELMGRHKDGDEIPLEISFGEFTKGDRRFFTGIARDITERKRTEEERKRAEEERRQAEDALRRSREERLAELERVRTRIATDLHDDIGSSLTQIAILGEVAHRNVEVGDRQRGIEPLQRIISVSNELVDTMSDIVWAINPKRDHLSDLVHRMRRFASDIFTARGISLVFDAPAGDGDAALGANLRREVFLIFKETVNNTVKHSGCTTTRIKLQMDGDWLALEVADDGNGFEFTQPVEGDVSAASDARGGNGIPSMRKRAGEMGGHFEIMSTVGKGTTTTLRVFVQNRREVDELR
jgi:PAS domain S-box-containing protein